MKKISVAFCFDENMYMLAGVAITSLLYHAMDKCAYDIYCVVPEHFSLSKRDELSKIVHDKDSKSTITFLNANHDYDSSVVKQYTTGIYFRFMLVDLLPNLDKIIYCDVDVTFHDNLIDLYDIDMKQNLIAGVADADQIARQYPSKLNGYVNSGVLMMNLKEIRKQKLNKVWLELSKSDAFAYPDQDILNKTCDGKILYLPIRYNYMPGPGGRYERAITNNIYTPQDYDIALKNPCITHYILRQPWRNRDNLVGELWWKYAYMTPFYAAFKNKIDQQPNLLKKDVFLFNFIKIMTIKIRDTKNKYYLFGFIPLFLIKKAVSKR